MLLLYLGIPVPALKDCEYKYYRGSEWLRFLGTDDIQYKIYLSGYMTIENYLYDEECDVYRAFNRFMYTPDMVNKLISECKGDL